MKTKAFEVTVEFKTATVIVMAKTETDAKQKVYKRLERRKASTLIEKRNTSVIELA